MQSVQMCLWVHAEDEQKEDCECFCLLVTVTSDAVPSVFS